MISADTKPEESPYALWQQTVSARYKDRSFVARNRSGVEVDPVYGGLDRHGDRCCRMRAIGSGLFNRKRTVCRPFDGH